MSFTIKEIFPALNLTEEELNKHRMAVGTRVRDCWINLHKTLPQKVEEDGYMACSYDEHFRCRAEAIIVRYLSNLTPVREKRPRRRATGYEKI